MVQEKYGPAVRFPDFWKLPGGLVDKGEDLANAAVREVREETGAVIEEASIATIIENLPRTFAGRPWLGSYGATAHEEGFHPYPAPQEGDTVIRAAWLRVADLRQYPLAFADRLEQTMGRSGSGEEARSSLDQHRNGAL